MGTRKYKTNENYFENIDTEEKSYWLGFIYADGYVSYRKKIKIVGDKKYYSEEYLVGIDLCVDDAEHLEKFRKIITEKPLKIYKPSTIKNLKNRVRLTINSKKMFYDLMLLGVVPNKSLILKFPTHIKSHLLSHFIRGYFDGDGSIWVGNMSQYIKKYDTYSTYKILKTDICGTYEFLNELNKILNICNDSCLKKEKRTDTNTWKLEFASTTRSKIFYEYIYENSTIHLERKYKKYIDFLKYE